MCSVQYALYYHFQRILLRPNAAFNYINRSLRFETVMIMKIFNFLCSRNSYNHLKIQKKTILIARLETIRCRNRRDLKKIKDTVFEIVRDILLCYLVNSWDLISNEQCKLQRRSYVFNHVQAYHRVSSIFTWLCHTFSYRNKSRRSFNSFQLCNWFEQNIHHSF